MAVMKIQIFNEYPKLGRYYDMIDLDKYSIVNTALCVVKDMI